MTMRTARRTVRVAVTATSPAASPHRFAGLAAGERRRALWPALALAIFEVVGTIGASQGQPEARDLDPLALVLVLAAPVALVWRRTRPEVALGVAFASVMAYLALDYPKGPIFLGLIAAYVNAVVMGWRRLAVAVLVGGYVLVAWVMPAFDDRPWPDWSVAGALAAWLLVLGSASELIRVQLERAGERQAARAEEARRRASEERLRIARELHDVLAHNISLINVQAGVALHLIDERARAGAARAGRHQGRQQGGPRRAAVGARRAAPGDEAAPCAPTAGLADLERPRRAGRGTGLDVRVERVTRRAGVRRASLPAGRRRPGRLPHRPGGADQRGAPRRRRPRHGRGCAHAATLLDGAGGRRRHGRGTPPAARRRARPGSGRGIAGHARAGRRRWAAPRGGAPPRPAASGCAARAAATTERWRRDPRRCWPTTRPSCGPGSARCSTPRTTSRSSARRPTATRPWPWPARYAARRRADGHPHAGHRRAGRHPRASSATTGSAAVRVVILTTFELDEYVFEAIRSGASGLPGEGHRAGRAAAGGARGRRRRRAAVARRHPPPHRRVRHRRPRAAADAGARRA